MNDPGRFKQSDASSLASGGEPPHHVLMEHRITALETRLDTILPTLATKADISDVRGDIKGWMLGTVLTIIVAMIGTIITLSHASREAPYPAVQQPPVIIQVPYPTQTPATSSSSHK